jgi:hypothetical protein
MFGQFEFECELEFELEFDGVVIDDEPLDDPDEDDDFPLAALAIAAPPTAIAPTTTTAASVFRMRLAIYHLLSYTSPSSQPLDRVRTMRRAEEASKNRDGTPPPTRASTTTDACADSRPRSRSSLCSALPAACARPGPRRRQVRIVGTRRGVAARSRRTCRAAANGGWLHGNLTTFLTGIVHPLPIAATPGGALLVGDWETGTIYRITRA